MTERLELRYVDLATLRRWDRNAKRHDLGALAESITRHGFRDPPAYDPALNAGEGGIVEGNGRGDALSAMQAQGQPAPRGVVVEGGAWLVPVLFGVDAPSQAAAEAYGIAHNNLTMAGGDFTDLDMAGMWEPEGYAALLRSLAEQGEIPVSIDATALDALLAGLAGAPKPGAGGDEFDTTPDDGPTRCQLGDLWSIGGVHRLLVGDCTDPANVARLMQGERADAVITDPPYGMKLDTDYTQMAEWANRQPGGKYEGFRRKGGSSKSIKHAPVIGDDRPFNPSHIFDLFGYVAEMFLFGADYYAEKIPDRSSGSWLVWDKREDSQGGNVDTMFGSSFELCWSRSAHKRDIVRVRWAGYFGTETQDTKKRVHPTQKPIQVIEWILDKYTKDNHLVVDVYLGSGTTMVAANNLGRRCFGCEIEPRYADVVLKRMESLGLSAVRCEAEGLTVERTS